jgi:hypothetical protein
MFLSKENINAVASVLFFLAHSQILYTMSKHEAPELFQRGG